MISLEAQAAVSYLQQQTDSKKSAHDSFELDRIDRALDEITRNPDKTTPPRRQVRSARANALKVVRHHVALEAFSLDDPELHEHKRQQAEIAVQYGGGIEDVEMREWLDHTPSLTDDERTLLHALADGFDAELIALARNLPIKRVRERISRARRAARRGYYLEVTCA